MATHNMSIMAVPEIPALQDSAGAFTYWALHGGTDTEILQECYEDAGLPKALAPRSQSPKVALKHALNRVLLGKHQLLQRRLGDGVHAIVHEQREGAGVDADLEYGVQLKVWVGADDQAEGDVECALLDAVKAEYGHQLGTMNHGQVGDWLKSYCLSNAGAAGVTMRPSGGVYFVPPARMDAWRLLASVLAESGATHIVYTIPAVDSAGAVRAVTDAILGAAATMVEEVRGELDELGRRALNTRRERAEALLDKAKGFQHLLGDAFGEVAAQVTGLKATVAAAQIKLMREDSDTDK